jgi:hypothetical protein
MIHRMILGINYEGGKIIKHIMKQKGVVAYANVQIRMDSPWHGEIADDSKRNLGPFETQFTNYTHRRSQMIEKLTLVFRKAQDIIEESKDVDQLIVQIARGKAAEWFIPDIILPIIESLSSQVKSMVKIIKGYRTNDYYINHSSSLEKSEKFVFINIGMFASVTPSQLVEVCVPIYTLDITMNGRDLNVLCWNKHVNDFGATIGLTPMILAGIPDDAPFIVPDKYDYMTVSSLFKNVNN